MDAPCGDPYPSTDLEQPQAQRCRACPGKRCPGESLTKAVVENVSEAREVEPDGVGIEQVGRAALGEQVALQFLHTIFRITPCTIEGLVKGPAGMALRTERRDRGLCCGLDRRAAPRTGTAASPTGLMSSVRSHREWQPESGLTGKHLIRDGHRWTDGLVASSKWSRGIASCRRGGVAFPASPMVRKCNFQTRHTPRLPCRSSP